MMGPPMAAMYPRDPLVLDWQSTCQCVLVSIGWCRNDTKSDLQMLSQLVIRAAPKVSSKEMPGRWTPSLSSHLGEQKFTHQSERH